MSTKMILQNIIFPNQNICDETELYYRNLTGTVELQENHLVMEAGSKMNFFTYFNAFSASKWQKYTTAGEIMLALTCRGKGTITLCQATMQGENLTKKALKNYPVNATEPKEIFLCFGDTIVPENTVYYIKVESLENLEIHGGYYHCAQMQPKITVNLAIGICTYHREEFVHRTLQSIHDAFLSQPDSTLYQHLQIFVSDNGNTLSKSALNTNNIHIVYNRNVGGAGGFGRCMLEAMHAMEQFHFTHILLMDDDIKLEPDTILRTYAFLSLLRSSYRNHLLAGALLRMDVPYIQHANGELWGKGRIGQTKAGYDLRQEYMLVKNEENLPIEYSGWWYCCIPINAVTDPIFPLPIFIHRDDIEHGLRYHGNLLTLNGIGVWHDAFDHRRSSSMEYYDTRNALICNAIHYPEIRTVTAVWSICKHLLGLLLRYRYEDQLLVLKAVEDFCKGIDFLKTQDTVKLHQEITQMGYSQKNVEKELEQNQLQSDYVTAKPDELYLRKSFSLWQKFTLNGWLLPANRICKPVPFGAHPVELYRCKRVLLFDPDSRKGLLLERKHRQLWISLMRCLKLWRLLQKHYRRTVQDYQVHAKELMTIEFWEQYLEQ